MQILLLQLLTYWRRGRRLSFSFAGNKGIVIYSAMCSIAMLYAPMQGVNRSVQALTLPSNRVDKISERCYILASNRAWLAATLIGDVDGLTYIMQPERTYTACYRGGCWPMAIKHTEATSYASQKVDNCMDY